MLHDLNVGNLASLPPRKSTVTHFSKDMLKALRLKPEVLTYDMENKRTLLELGERVMVVGMAGEDYCEHEMYVDVSWKGKVLAVPLVQLNPLDADEDSIEATGDWHYWSKRGYTF